MGRRISTKVTKVDLDYQTDTDFTAWSEREGRSKKRHMGILIRKLTQIQKANPAALAAIGLMDRDFSSAGAA
jgi:hypothetical protein